MDALVAQQPTSRSLGAWFAAIGVVATAIGIARIDAKGVERIHRLPMPVLAVPDRTSLALAGGKLGKLNVRAKVLEARSVPTSSPVIAIAPWDGKLAVASFDDGAWILDGDAALPLALGTAVNDLAPGPDGWLFAATNDGAFRVSRAGKVEKLADGVFSAVAIWRGQPYFASAHGLATVDAQGFITYGAERGLVPERPDALAACGSVLCIAAEDGLWLFDGSSTTRRSSGSGDLTSDAVTAVAFDGTSIIAGTFDAGFASLGTRARRMAPVDGLVDGRINPRALVSWNGLFLAGTPTGLAVVRGDDAGHVTNLPAKEITAVAATSPAVWVGYRGGLARIELEVP